jgi:hypothetical protein
MYLLFEEHAVSIVSVQEQAKQAASGVRALFHSQEAEISHFRHPVQ